MQLLHVKLPGLRNLPAEQVQIDPEITKLLMQVEQVEPELQVAQTGMQAKQAPEAR